MIQELVVREMARVGYYIDTEVKLAGAGKREEVLELFDNMHQVFPHWVIATCPMMHPDIQYFSRNCPFVFGYDEQFLIRNSGLEKFILLVHEDDRKDLYACMTFMHRYLEDVPPEEHCRYRVIFHYRFRNPDGRYIYLHDEKAALQLGSSGNLYYVLFRNAGEEKAFAGVKLELFRQDETLVKVREFRPTTERNPLTPREKELVQLIRQGLSTKEIAFRLSISHNTVRNIKSKLFEKYNVANSIELLNLTA